MENDMTIKERNRMSEWVEDIWNMHNKFGVHEWFAKQVKENNTEVISQYLNFRLTMIYEELGETLSAALVQNDPEEVVDGLIDLCVFAIGTLDVFGIDIDEAWTRVHRANMMKEAGEKPERPNPFGLPDMIKLDGWEAPHHDDNIGALDIGLGR